jgi:hypothetical protein
MDDRAERTIEVIQVSLQRRCMARELLDNQHIRIRV